MKKVLLILTTILLLLVATSCTRKVEIPLSIVYTQESGKFVVTNNTSKNYNDIYIHFEAYDAKGYKKQFMKGLATFNQGQEVTFNLYDSIDNAEEVVALELTHFTYEKFNVPLIFVVGLIISVGLVFFLRLLKL